jgi:MEDS: MEthanogen/methylotroph, DcmR Sensory domain
MADGYRAGTGLEHPALLYASRQDFLETMVPFVADGIDDHEFVFVAARADNLAALVTELGERAASALWADTEQWHPHPATRLRAFHELVTDQLDAGATRLRLVGEPVWPSGPPELVREWQRYESVLNSVLAPFPVSLMCLYDTARLDPDVVEVASRTHPVVRRSGTQRPSGRFEDPERFLSRWNPEPPPPPRSAARLAPVTDLPTARRFLSQQAIRAGLRPARVGDLCTAANEVLTESLVHKAAAALWTWSEAGHFVCHIEARGHDLANPLSGYQPPEDGTAGSGWWLARQLVDLLQVVPSPSGISVRLHLDLGPPVAYPTGV